MPSSNDYREILVHISTSAPNKTDQKYLQKHLSSIVNDMIEFSQYMTEIVNVLFRKGRLIKSKVLHELQALVYVDSTGSIYRMKKKEAEQLYQLVQEYKQKKNTPQSSSKKTTQKGGGAIYNLFLSNMNAYNDFTTRLDFVYLLLFLLASIPFLGLFPNIMISIKALRDGRTFLAILNTLTTFLSLFEFHMVDLGAVFKIMYSLDVLSMTKYVNPSKAQESPAPSLFGSLMSSAKALGSTLASSALTQAQQSIQQKQQQMVAQQAQRLSSSITPSSSFSFANTMQSPTRPLTSSMPTTPTPTTTTPTPTTPSIPITPSPTPTAKKSWFKKS